MIRDGERVFYLNVNDKFLQAAGTLAKTIMPDPLHPNAKEYAIWGQAMEPTLKKLMEENLRRVTAKPNFQAPNEVNWLIHKGLRAEVNAAFCLHSISRRDVQ
ncbi:MAG: hypothetical protein ACQESR_07835 [Planctomycetota bacterium]